MEMVLEKVIINTRYLNHYSLLIYVDGFFLDYIQILDLALGKLGQIKVEKNKKSLQVKKKKY